MRVIIAGGSGLIGRELTQLLSAHGHEVIVLSRSPHLVTDLPGSARALRWDARTAGNWGHLVDNSTAIVNLAGTNIGEGRWTAQRKRAIISSRTNASAAVVQAVQASDSNPEVVIQASAVGYYGNRGDEILTEASNPAADYFPAEVCVRWERAIQAVAEFTRLVVIRTGIVLSSKGGALPKLLTPFKMFAGGPFGDGKQWFPWIHLSDEARAVAFLIAAKEAGGVFNLTAPGVARNRTFARTLGAALGRPSRMPTPAPVLRLALGEMSALLLDGQRASSQKLRDAGFDFRYGEAGPALRDLIDSPCSSA